MTNQKESEALMAALEPFALVADEYDDREDDSFEVWVDAGPERTIRASFKLAHYRRARAVYQALSRPTQSSGEAGKRCYTIPGDADLLANNLTAWVREAMRFIDLCDADAGGYYSLHEDAERLTREGYMLFGANVDFDRWCLADLEHRTLSVFLDGARPAPLPAEREADGEVCSLDPRGAKSRLSVLAGGKTIHEAYHPSTFSDPVAAFWGDVAALSAPAPPVSEQAMVDSVAKIIAKHVYGANRSQSYWGNPPCQSAAAEILAATPAQPVSEQGEAIREAAAKIAETPFNGEQDDITMEAKDRIAAAIRAIPLPAQPHRLDGGQFKRGDRVEKVSGSKWRGVVVGEYSTALTSEGYAVESDTETGSVQIYPAKALRLVGQSVQGGEDGE